MAQPAAANPAAAQGATAVDVWQEDKDKCAEFIRGCKHRVGRREVYKYQNLMQAVANRETTVVPIELDDVKDFHGLDFAEKIRKNVLRYIDIFYLTIDSSMPEPNVEFNDANTSAEDMINEHRRQTAAESGVELPPHLTRRYEVVVRGYTPERSENRPDLAKTLSVRQLRADNVGSLVRIKAIVTRASDVKPRLVYAAYTCTQCQNETIQEIKSEEFMPLSECQLEECRKNKAGAKLVLQTRGSKFISFQELRVQEMSYQVPTGHTPRAMNVYARGNATRQANPGDEVTITGAFLPAVEGGWRQLRSGLLATTFLEAYEIVQEKATAGAGEADEEHAEQVVEISQDPDMFDKLAQSIAPEIYGNLDVKKALLLMLVGGVGRALSDGMKIRGDINVCLMGDPGVAKSQLLRYICAVSPRGVFTTGKGSSGVGLTASVQRDPLTDELILEGGALVLADKGICAIDEFDKMDEYDRTAIYEVMEQQTISIAKAGITTTLNARASILAAANPLYGRYNESKSILENINLPSALLSRFDLLFLLLDRPSEANDRALARHVTYVHMFSEHPPLDFEPIPMAVIRAYAARAKQIEPTVPPELHDYIVQEYCKLRQAGEAGECLKSTPRTLLALLRLSTAMARLRFADEVAMSDVRVAQELMQASKYTLENSREQKEKRRGNYISEIADIIHSLMTKNRYVRMDLARRYATQGNAFTAKQFEETVEYYLAEGIWIRDDANTVLRFVQQDE